MAALVSFMLVIAPAPSKAAPRLATPTTGNPSAHSEPNGKRTCKKRSVRPRCASPRRARARASVINGYRPHPSQWPWIARLSMGCGGTLIQPRLVVTAAHCVTDQHGRPDVQEDGVTATLGRRTLSDTSVGESIRTDRIVVHEGWDPEGFVNDVALLRLSYPSSAQTATLGDAQDWRSPATAMGWGMTTHPGPQSDILLAADLPLLSDQYCADTAPAAAGLAYVPTVMMCAGAAGSSTCHGDSGGPVMVGDGAGAGWELIGLVSFGDPNCRTDLPDYFAWVAGPSLRAWVVQHAQQLTAAPPPAAAAPPSGAAPSVDRDAPRFATMIMWPTRFRAARRGPTTAAIGAVGTTVRYRIDEDARVTFRVIRRGGRDRRGKVLGTFTHRAQAGHNRFGFSGRLRGRRLGSGRYTLVARATDAARNRSVAELIDFRIVR